MSKIIPWNLPEVAGGSVGGYTPEPEPEPPTPSVYINVDNLAFSDTSMIIYKSPPTDYTVIAGNSSATITTATDLRSGGFSGMVAENLIGVASIQLHVSADTTWNDKHYTTSDLVFDVDPLTLACTVNSGTFEVENLKASEISVNYVNPYRDGYTSSFVVNLVVYNGNGEILQTQEVTLV